MTTKGATGATAENSAGPGITRWVTFAAVVVSGFGLLVLVGRSGAGPITMVAVGAAVAVIAAVNVRTFIRSDDEPAYRRESDLERDFYLAEASTRLETAGAGLDVLDIVRVAESTLGLELNRARARGNGLLTAGLGLVVLGIAAAWYGVVTAENLAARVSQVGEPLRVPFLSYALIGLGGYVQLIAAVTLRLYATANRDVHAYAGKMVYVRQLMAAVRIGEIFDKEPSRRALLALRDPLVSQLPDLAGIVFASDSTSSRVRLRLKHGTTEGSADIADGGTGKDSDK